MKFGNFEPTPGDWKKAKKEENPDNREALDQSLERLRNRVDEIYQKKEEITEQEISELRELLAQVPNLVINFDDTITQPPLPDPEDPSKKKMNQSIKLIAGAVVQAHPEKRPTFKEFSELLGSKPEFPKVQYFYEKCLAGVSKEELMEIYDSVVRGDDEYKEVRINTNFFDICRKMKESRGITRVPLFVLSLNTPDLIRKFYEENQQQLDDFETETGVKVEVITIMGNQVDFSEDGEVCGVFEHVRDDNKHMYIPEGSLMLADDRETQDLIDHGVNAVNIQRGSLELPILDISLKINEVSQQMTELELGEDKSFRDTLENLKVYGFHAKVLNEKVLHPDNETKQPPTRSGRVSANTAKASRLTWLMIYYSDNLSYERPCAN